MPQDYKDYVFANGGIEGQVTPTFVSQPGVLSTAQLAVVTSLSALGAISNFQISTQDNGFPNNYLSNYGWLTTVSGPIYSAAGSRSAV